MPFDTTINETEIEKPKVQKSHIPPQENHKETDSSILEQKANYIALERVVDNYKIGCGLCGFLWVIISFFLFVMGLGLYGSIALGIAIFQFYVMVMRYLVGNGWEMNHWHGLGILIGIIGIIILLMEWIVI